MHTRTEDGTQSFSHAHFGGNDQPPPPEPPSGEHGSPREHAVISMFDLFSIGIGPSSSHTVGPMRAGTIFVSDLRDSGLLDRVARIKLALYGSLAATGKGHMTPQALLLGLEGADCETVDTASVPVRYEDIVRSKVLTLGKDTPERGEPKQIMFDYERDLKWMWGQTLPMHSNGMRMSVFDKDGDLLATNDFYSIGGGFVVNGAMATANTSGPTAPRELLQDGENPVAPIVEPSPPEVSPTVMDDIPTSHPVDTLENVYYKSVRRQDAPEARREGKSTMEDASVPLLGDSSEPKPAGDEPPYPFHNMDSLLAITRKHNLTIAQVVYENELTWATPEEVNAKIMRIWRVMDEGIRAGVHSTEEVLPGSLKLKRRAPVLYSRLTRGPYIGGKSQGISGDKPRYAIEGKQETAVQPAARRRERQPRVRGSFNHEVIPVPQRRPDFPAMNWLSCWAIATNEQVASGGRIVIAPTLGAAGIIPAVLRYVVEFVAISPEDEENLIMTFLLTAAAIGMLFKRGATISAAEGGCMAEVGTSCSMAAGAFAACMGGSPEVIEQAAETAIEHNLGLTCDPVDGLVQAPCIERNAVGAVKAVVSANLALSYSGTNAISLDEAIHAARLTAADMHTKYKETSLSGLATTVKIPVAVPDC
ncbi:hypothetical protein MCUN1_003719 [Malassezia cuniculi]|uniref:L-serine ammonia-lyase n=1 Tax=Malassezia cuniculi TaxID=948313 RepID=A0AAF0EYI9_9BASI|nr:hypothetical protein MCUN1_003719 [Malassezia cuniculi]